MLTSQLDKLYVFEVMGIKRDKTTENKFPFPKNLKYIHILEFMALNIIMNYLHICHVTCLKKKNNTKFIMPSTFSTHLGENKVI